MESFWGLAGDTALVLWAYVSCWYLVAVFLKRNDVADIAWGLGFVVACTFLLWRSPHVPLLQGLTAIVALWGIRLSLHIGMRNRAKAEDFRYRQWREEWGNTVLWRSYLQVFLLQGLFMGVIASPVIWVAANQPASLAWINFLGAAVWLAGYVVQAVADAQLAVFVRTKKPGEIMQTGLWAYSRHPNYFGEIVMWWGVWIASLSIPGSGWLVVSPLVITWLLARVSGVPMMEAKYKDNPAFQEYRRRTSALIPWRPKDIPR